MWEIMPATSHGSEDAEPDGLLQAGEAVEGVSVEVAGDLGYHVADVPPGAERLTLDVDVVVGKYGVDPRQHSGRVAVDVHVIDVQPSTATQPVDRTRGLLVVTNLGAPCVLNGFPSLVASVGRTSSARLAVSHVDQPGMPAPIDVVGGAAAYAGLEWTSASTCATAGNLRLAISHGSGPVPVDVDGAGGAPSIQLCPGPVTAGPFEQTAEGTVS